MKTVHGKIYFVFCVFIAVLIMDHKFYSVHCFWLNKKNEDFSEVVLQDFFVGEAMVLSCNYQRNLSNNPSAFWKFESFKKAKCTYYPASTTYMEADVISSLDKSQIAIDSLAVTDSGRYECVTHKPVRTFIVQIHDPEDMEYVISSRGQEPWEDTMIGDYQVALEWSEWTTCDGCSGSGERRMFGFCYATWSGGRLQCKAPMIPSPLKALARGRREEIIVDICYDHCREEEEPLLVTSQRLDVLNGADVTLTCHKNSSVYSSIRWERDGDTLLRSDVSHGYRSVQPIYVSENNELLLHSVELPQGGIIRLACVEERRKRVIFDLHVKRSSDVEQATFIEHLYWIGISSALQTIAFLFVLLCYVTAQNCMDVVKSEAHEFEALKQSDSDDDTDSETDFTDTEVSSDFNDIEDYDNVDANIT